MKIMLISELPLPSPGKGYRAQPLIEYLPQFGFQVTAVCPVDAQRGVRVIEDTEIHYVMPAYNKGLRYSLRFRLALMNSIFAEVRRLMRSESFDLIRGISLFPAFIGLLASGRRMPVIAELPDFYSELYSAFDLPFANVGSILLRRMESWTARNLAVSFVESPAQREIWIERGVNPKLCVVLPDGVYPTKFNPNLSGHHIRDKYGIIETDSVVFYHGDISEVDGVDVLIRAASLVVKNLDRRVIFLIVGTGSRSYVKNLVELTTKLGLSKNIIFTGWIQDFDEIPYYIAAADVCVAPFRTFLGTNTAVMQKIKEYIAMGKPTVTSYGRGLSQMTGDLLHMVLPEDHVELAKVITQVLTTNAGERRMRALNMAKRMDWKYIVKEEANIMLHIVKHDVKDFSIYDYLFNP